MSKVIEHDDEDYLSFPDLDYSDENLNKVWKWIRDDLAQEGRVYNHQIAAKHEECPASYKRSTLEDVLSKLRSALKQNEIIDVEHEPGGDDEKGGGTRNVWVLDE